MLIHMKRQAVTLGILAVAYGALMSYHYYSSVESLHHSYERTTNNLLLYNRAISNFVAKEQRPSVEKLLKDSGKKEFFSPCLQSSSYITNTINKYTNAERVKEGLPELHFKWASTNPLNIDNFANPLEHQWIEEIKLDDTKKFNKVYENNGRVNYYFAIAGNRMVESCLQCHDTPSSAPKDLTRVYGTTHGYGFKVGEMASIISVHIDIDDEMQALQTKLVKEGLILLLIFILLYGLVVWIHYKKCLLEDKASRDPLTKLLNRNLYFEIYNKEKQRCSRDFKYLAHITLDIDFFKQYNDTYGHIKGDIVLQKVAHEMERSFNRVSDFIFRIGGEEFAIVCSASSVEDIHNMGENLCKNIEMLRLEHLSSSVQNVVTISVGISILACTSNVPFEEVCEQSDVALYKAKSAGRNQVHIIQL
ncbi:MAG TPA: diguanylate cyclase [Sulfuricurvum sp.]|nr:MAG: hypothetical protein B7Y30_11940 [Campylobacterales bacterium 16-40-21]OZA04017.1 MAG: hypothetical protein B7X89_00230 [Sulfuricurvum sp. 17-40-25]HQS66017.1 diguanylate cyclase [Sulfuricurvum sp.]